MEKYVKARYEGSKRSYCFLAEDDLQPGDKAITQNGAIVTVVDDPVDMSWLDAYGRNKIKTIKKSEDIEVREVKGDRK